MQYLADANAEGFKTMLLAVRNGDNLADALDIGYNNWSPRDLWYGFLGKSQAATVVAVPYQTIEEREDAGDQEDPCSQHSVHHTGLAGDDN